MILYGLIIVIHVISCIVLILVILLQAGRGGGLAEPLGGGSTQTIFGTKASTFLTRATAVCAVLYILTCLSLGVLTSRKSVSLMEKGSAFPIPEIPAQGAQDETADGLPPITPLGGGAEPVKAVTEPIAAETQEAPAEQPAQQDQ